MNETILLGNNNWGIKSGGLLGYRYSDSLNVYFPREITFTRISTGTIVNSYGQIEEVPYNLLLRTEEFENNYWSNNDRVIVTNTSTSPNNTNTADLIYPLTSGPYRGTFVAGFPVGTYNFSVYAKSSGKDFLFFYVVGSTASNGVWFNLNTGTVETTGSSWSNVNIQNVGNGWYRCSASVTLITTPSNNLYYLISDTNNDVSVTTNGTDGLYIWGAQLTQGTELKPYTPIGSTRNGFPRIDFSYGNPTLLIEPQRQNLILQSENLTDSSWAQEGSVIIPNSTMAPDGLTTNNSLQEEPINDIHRIYPTNAITVTSGANYTSSFFVKKDTQRYVRLVFAQSIVTDVWVAVQFDLDTLTFTSGVGSGGGTFVSASIKSAPNGFYRITLVGAIPATAARVFLAQSNGSEILSSNSRGCNSYVGNNTNRIWVWGGQLELGSYATSYIPTKTSPTTRNPDGFSMTNISHLIGQTRGVIMLDFYYDISLTTGHELFYVYNTSTQYLYRARIGANGSNIFAIIYANGSSAKPMSPNITLIPNNRYKIASVYDYTTNSTKTFINGSLIGTTVGTDAYPTNQDKINSGNLFGAAQYSVFNQIYISDKLISDAEAEELTTI